MISTCISNTVISNTGAYQKNHIFLISFDTLTVGIEVSKNLEKSTLYSGLI